MDLCDVPQLPANPASARPSRHTLHKPWCRTRAQATTCCGSAKTLHTYAQAISQEIVSLVVVDSAKLSPLLPAGYTLKPAVALGLGAPDQGVVVIANRRGIEASIDGGPAAKEPQVNIYLGIVIAPPAAAAGAGVLITDATHFYLLEVYTNAAVFADTFRSADMPIEFVKPLVYLRNINDATGAGTLEVVIPDLKSPLASANTGISLAPLPGATEGIFWHDGKLGTAGFYFRDAPQQLGNATSRIYTAPGSRWGNLFEGGGLGSCGSHAGFACVSSPAINSLYPQGGQAYLFLVS